MSWLVISRFTDCLLGEENIQLASCWPIPPLCRFYDASNGTEKTRDVVVLVVVRPWCFVERKWPIVIEHSLRPSVGLCVCVCVCAAHYGKLSDRIWMWFGMVGQMVPGMSHVVYGLVHRVGGNFWVNVGRPNVTNRVFLLHHGPFPNEFGVFCCCLCQERDGYKSIIDSYESEITLSAGGRSDARLRQNLDEVIIGLRKHSAALEADVEKAANEALEYKTRIVLVRWMLFLTSAFS